MAPLRSPSRRCGQLQRWKALGWRASVRSAFASNFLFGAERGVRKASRETGKLARDEGKLQGGHEVGERRDGVPRPHLCRRTFLLVTLVLGRTTAERPRSGVLIHFPNFTLSERNSDAGQPAVLKMGPQRCFPSYAVVAVLPPPPGGVVRLADAPLRVFEGWCQEEVDADLRAPRVLERRRARLGCCSLARAAFSRCGQLQRFHD